MYCGSQSLFVFLQKVEGRVASDQELKLTELLRYYMRDIQAAKVRHICRQPSYRIHKFKIMLLVHIYYHRLELTIKPHCPWGKREGENNLKRSELQGSHFPVNMVLETSIFVVSSTRANYVFIQTSCEKPCYTIVHTLYLWLYFSTLKKSALCENVKLLDVELNGSLDIF